MHVISGKSNGEESYGTCALCIFCSNEHEIQTERTDATKYVEKQFK